MAALRALSLRRAGRSSTGRLPADAELWTKSREAANRNTLSLLYTEDLFAEDPIFAEDLIEPSGPVGWD
jgi:hypothetical protein